MKNFKQIRDHFIKATVSLINKTTFFNSIVTTFPFLLKNSCPILTTATIPNMNFHGLTFQILEWKTKTPQAVHNRSVIYVQITPTSPDPWLESFHSLSSIQNWCSDGYWRKNLNCVLLSCDLLIPSRDHCVPDWSVSLK